MVDYEQITAGDQGEWVDYLRQVLDSHGYTTAQAAGPFDDELDSVVRQYQTDQGLSADGVVGPKTWTALVPDDTGTETESSIVIDWSSLPWLSSLAQYDASEDGARQFLIDNGIPAELLAAGE
jgi:peptidoglycan hydrolase-like protein with peptidoglycan-binding domain